MKRLLLSLIFSGFCLYTWAQSPYTGKACDVTITMNPISKNIVLKNKSTGAEVNVGDVLSGNSYMFRTLPGEYVLHAYSGETLNGTIDLTITEEETQQFRFYTVTTYATNPDWTLDADYTIHIKSVSGKDGELRNTTLGSSTTANRATFLVYPGDTYSIRFLPGQDRQDEGYLTFEASGRVNSNTTKSGSIPMGYSYSITVPEGAAAFVGTKEAHFKRFTEVAADNVSTSGENTVYTYKLAGSQQYNYRISQPGKVTYASVFNKTASGESMTITPAMLEGDPKAVDRDAGSNNGFNVADIFLNINEKGHLKLALGDMYQLVNIRAWQTVNSITANYFIEPDFHYTVINEEGNADNSVVTVDGRGLLKAEGNGTAIVLVTYDAINVASAAGGPFFSAILPENTGAFVVSVGAPESGIISNMIINEALNSTSNKVSGINVDAELDVFYYLKEEGGYEYTFTPDGVSSVALAQPVIGTNTVTYNGFSSNDVTKNEGGSYTVRLTHGRNIVKMVSPAGTSYQVLTAKPVTYTVSNVSRPEEKIQPGDNVSVRFNTLYHPNSKLSGVYNMAASIQYTVNETTVTGKANQYMFASTEAAQTISATIPEDWDTGDDFVFTGGVIKSNGFGDPFGAHREITLENGRDPNFSAVFCTGYFGALPDVRIKLKDDIITGIPEIPADNGIAVYPNPFTGYIKVRTSVDSQVSVYNISGHRVLNAMVEAGETRIETSSLPKGAYIVKCGEKTMKVIK